MNKVGTYVVVALLLGFALLMLWIPWRQDSFDNSAIGSNGLSIWLKNQGIDTVKSNKNLKRKQSELSLRILPIADFYNKQNTNEKLPKWVSERIFDEKLEELDTLLILPKWRNEITQKGIAKQSLLISNNSIHDLFVDSIFSKLKIIRLNDQITTETIKIPSDKTYKVSLYRAQLFDRNSLPEDCDELIGFNEGALLLSCELDYTTYILSDPDVLNNHGLAMNDNAAFSAPLIKYLKNTIGNGSVYLDTDTQLLLNDENDVIDEGQDYERTLSSLMRLFDYPLNIIWAAILVISLMCFWRGIFRFGSPLKDTAAHIELSKTATINAMGRILRLSGNDGNMVSQYVSDLLIDKSCIVFGASSRNADSIERLYQRLSKKDPAFANELRSLSNTLIFDGPGMGQHELYSKLELFRDMLRRLNLES